MGSQPSNETEDHSFKSRGWRQGSVFDLEQQPGLAKLLQSMGIEDPPGFLIVCSHSCDIAHSNSEKEPSIEFIAANRIDSLDPARSHSHNPRELHTALMSVSHGPDNAADRILISLRSSERFCIERTRLADINPDSNIRLNYADKMVFIDWLAARYKRIELPDAFNDRIVDLDQNRKKFRRLAKKHGSELEGIYINLIEEVELEDGDVYHANVIALVHSSSSADIEAMKKELAEYFGNLSKVNIEIELFVLRGDELSAETYKSHQRFDFDYLTHRAAENSD